MSYYTLGESYNTYPFGMPQIPGNFVPLSIQTPPGRVTGYETPFNAYALPNQQTTMEGYEYPGYSRGTYGNPRGSNTSWAAPGRSKAANAVYQHRLNELGKLENDILNDIDAPGPSNNCLPAPIKSLYSDTFNNPDVCDRATCILSLDTNPPGPSAASTLGCKSFKQVINQCPGYEENSYIDLCYPQSPVPPTASAGPSCTTPGCDNSSYCTGGVSQSGVAYYLGPDAACAAAAEGGGPPTSCANNNTIMLQKNVTCDYAEGKCDQVAKIGVPYEDLCPVTCGTCPSVMPTPTGSPNVNM